MKKYLLKARIQSADERQNTSVYNSRGMGFPVGEVHALWFN